MSPDDTFIKVALNNKEEEESEGEIELLTDTIEMISITESEPMILTLTNEEDRFSESISNNNISIGSLNNNKTDSIINNTTLTNNLHDNTSNNLLNVHKSNNKINKKEMHESMSDDIQIIEKREKNNKLIKKIDDFLSRSIEVLGSDLEVVHSNRMINSFNTNHKNNTNDSNSFKNINNTNIDNHSFKNEKNNYNNINDNLLLNDNNNIINNINNYMNDNYISDTNQISDTNFLDDNLFYFNKLIKENQSINKKRIKEIFYCLTNIFKIERFRTNQLLIIDTVLNNKDTFVLMPTGGGKSLCYQLPVLLEERITIVISPLIALIKDQVESLLRLNIPAVAFYGSMKKSDRDTCFDLLEEWIEGRGLVKIFYVTPELLNSSSRLEKCLSKVKVRFVIDEVHCLT